MGQRGLEFVDDPHMVNVAVSRAVRQFVLVTDHDLFFKKGKNIGDLIRYTFAIFFACSGVEIPTACRNHAGNLHFDTQNY